MQNLDQLRAAYSWEKVTKTKTAPKINFQEYTVLLKKLPALIATNGLGQAMAFLAGKAGADSRGEDGSVHGTVLAQVGEWLYREEAPYRGPYAGHDDPRLLQAIAVCDVLTYRRAHAEAMAIVNYLRTFAAALNDKEQS